MPEDYAENTPTVKKTRKRKPQPPIVDDLPTVDADVIKIFEEMSGPVIGYNPVYRRVTGSVTAGLMLGQAIFLQQSSIAKTTLYDSDGKRHDGFWWHSIAQWENKTGLTREEQEGARARLAKMNFLSERLAGNPAKVHFRCNRNRVIAAIGKLKSQEEDGGSESDEGSNDSKTPLTRLRQMPYLDSGRCPNKIAADALTSESSTEDISEISSVANATSTDEPSTNYSQPIQDSPSDDDQTFQSNNLSEAKQEAGDRLGSKKFAKQEAIPQETVSSIYKGIIGQYPQATQLNKRVTGGKIVTLLDLLEEAVGSDFELLTWACKDWQAEHKDWAASDRPGPFRYNDTQKVLDHVARLKALFEANSRQRPARQAKDATAVDDKDAWLKTKIEVTPPTTTDDDDWKRTPVDVLASLIDEDDA